MPKTAGTNRRRFIRQAVCAGTDLALLAALGPARASLADPAEDDRLVVLTFDDAVKTHRTFVAPLLKELGFGATFFVSHRWMAEDPKHFLTWQEIAEIHEMGFEIGNHSWTHPAFAVPKDAARLAAELALVEHELQKVRVPRPTSFAWCGNAFSPEAIRELEKLDYRLARRGMQPEVDYSRRTEEIGPLFDPRQHHRFLIPSTGDATPDWTLEHFQSVVERSRKGAPCILQFHGVPDPHAWVNTPPERFREYMDYLKHGQFKVISLRGLEQHVSLDAHPNDRLAEMRQPQLPPEKLPLPVEMQATRDELPYWLDNMVRQHRFSWQEAAQVAGFSVEAIRDRAREIGFDPAQPGVSGGEKGTALRVLPYPGGRHPRTGFREGAVLPQRGTKASVFLPWDPASYIVVDLPEAIFSNLGLLFLAHTHIPTIWDERNVWIDNVDWERRPDGGLSRRQRLPNQVEFGASIAPAEGAVEMELWLRNESSGKLTGLRTQICVMLAGAAGFGRQDNEHKLFRSPVAAARSAKEDRWILTAWNRCGRAWGNAPVPCLHADPVLPDCPPGEEVRLRGRLWFYEGAAIESELARVRDEFEPL